MRLNVVHSTLYRYLQPVAHSTQYIRLTPWEGRRQRVLRWHVSLPEPAVALTDAFGNRMQLLTIDRPHQALDIVARGEIDVDERDDGESAGPVNPRVFLRTTPLTRADDAIRAFIEPMRAIVRARPLIGINDLMHALLDRMPYEKGFTSVEHTAAESFAAGRGVCQDHSHVFLACCRELGIPARYVSGYAYSPADAEVASHAWAEAWLSGRWVSFDVSNAAQAGGAHVKLAVGLDYLDASPVRGVRVGGGMESLTTSAQVSAAS